MPINRQVYKYHITEEQWTKLNSLCPKYPGFFFVPFYVHGQLTAYVVIPPNNNRLAIYSEIARIMKSSALTTG